MVQLQQELEEAHGRGAALCGETRALVAGLRCWLRRHRERIRYRCTLPLAILHFFFYIANIIFIFLANKRIK